MRKSGILMHISSLPNEYGIGKFGKEAYAFADFLERSGQSFWQILPLSPTSYGDSPYQSFSIHAGNPYFIDFESLEKEGYLKAEEYKNINWGEDKSSVNYGTIYENIWKVLKIAHERFRQNTEKDYSKFVVSNKNWIFEYGLFMALKFSHDGKAWYQWEEPLKMRKPKAIKSARKKYAEEIDFWCFVQYKFFQQWFKLKKYANSKNIKIIGDIPIYCALDSVDVWAQPEYFKLDKEKKPIEVAGCPPDAFTADGQLWGNPLYRWDVMAKEKYRWWINRIDFAATMYDTVRIDHFRGFESYYCIPYGAKNAKKGKWRKGPELKLFKEVKKELGNVDLIAEDLGFLTKRVMKMLEQSGYPGMKVLEFGFDSDPNNAYLPHNYKNSNNICYTGTHDNETVLGWIKSADKKTADYCKKYLNVKNIKDVPYAMIRLAWSSISNTAIAQMQDFLKLDNSARMNTPSTVGENWKWRLSDISLLDDTLAENILDITKTYGRYNSKNKQSK